ncbi:unnamed protein product [Protopolystoma xenopodis]|uniref:Uncharacterized protein n=1 Tax=Protopolystoma xenopodis TaxID=117903 RepID=A0A448WR04_9PLAT|nr:unnamed protein product [Protopolystoma xenopodis]
MEKGQSAADSGPIYTERLHLHIPALATSSVCLLGAPSGGSSVGRCCENADIDALTCAKKSIGSGAALSSSSPPASHSHPSCTHTYNQQHTKTPVSPTCVRPASYHLDRRASSTATSSLPHPLCPNLPVRFVVLHQVVLAVRLRIGHIWPTLMLQTTLPIVIGSRPQQAPCQPPSLSGTHHSTSDQAGQLSGKIPRLAFVETPIGAAIRHRSRYASSTENPIRAVPPTTG